MSHVGLGCCQVGFSLEFAALLKTFAFQKARVIKCLLKPSK